MGTMRAVAECFNMMGGIPSPPIALEGPREVRAEKVSWIEIESRETCQEMADLKDLETVCVS